MDSREYRAKIQKQPLIGENMTSKPIKGYENYIIYEDGRIYSTNKNIFIGANPTTTSKYLYVQLYKNGKASYHSVHRLVAQTFVPNPDNLPVVDHIDNNIYNNHYKNLQWCTQKENIHKSYNHMGPVRNFRMCALYNNHEKIKEFKSISEACRYAYKKYGISATSLRKYHVVGCFCIKCND